MLGLGEVVTSSSARLPALATGPRQPRPLKPRFKEAQGEEDGGVTYLAAPGVVVSVAEHSGEDLDADSPASGCATYTSSTTSGLFASYAATVTCKPNPGSEVE